MVKQTYNIEVTVMSWSFWGFCENVTNHQTWFKEVMLKPSWSMEWRVWHYRIKKGPSACRPSKAIPPIHMFSELKLHVLTTNVYFFPKLDLKHFCVLSKSSKHVWDEMYILHTYPDMWQTICCTLVDNQTSLK